MARPPKDAVPGFSTLIAWAETLGEALGRGVARGINSALSNTQLGQLAGMAGKKKRGRPAKEWLGGPVPAERRCKVEGCPRAARSKGLCSQHYQAERRRLQSR